MTRIPARVPADLYEQATPLVKGIGRPSWGQLVAWTCIDHRDKVLDHVRSQIDGKGRREPRGQNREGTAGLQVTASVDTGELTAIDTIIKSVQAKTSDTKVTRTMVVIGALDVAVREHEADTKASD